MRVVTWKSKNKVLSQPWIRHGFLLLLLVIVASFSTRGFADSVTHEMRLTHHDFEPWSFTPKAHDVIKVVNGSDIAHSIYITDDAGNVVNLDVQLPGETVSWEIPATGSYLFQCWIHPVIRAQLTVESTDQAATALQENTYETGHHHQD